MKFLGIVVRLFWNDGITLKWYQASPPPLHSPCSYLDRYLKEHQLAHSHLSAQQERSCSLLLHTMRCCCCCSWVDSWEDEARPFLICCFTQLARLQVDPFELSKVLVLFRIKWDEKRLFSVRLIFSLWQQKIDIAIQQEMKCIRGNTISLAKLFSIM